MSEKPSGTQFCLQERLSLAHELVHFHINTTYYIILAEAFFQTKQLCHGTQLSSARCNIRRRKKRMPLSSWKLQKDIFLVYLTPNDNENLAGQVNFNFIIICFCFVYNRISQVVMVMLVTFSGDRVRSKNICFIL